LFLPLLWVTHAGGSLLCLQLAAAKFWLCGATICCRLIIILQWRGAAWFMLRNAALMVLPVRRSQHGPVARSVGPALLPAMRLHRSRFALQLIVLCALRASIDLKYASAARCSWTKARGRLPVIFKIQLNKILSPDCMLVPSPRGYSCGTKL
jgi:hypothetical protein